MNTPVVNGFWGYVSRNWGWSRNGFPMAVTGKALRSRASRDSFFVVSLCGAYGGINPAAIFPAAAIFFAPEHDIFFVNTLRVLSFVPPCPLFFIVREYTGDKYKRFVLW
jgi:hypothetical protein